MKTTTRLMHGDATCLDAVPRTSVDLVVTSPPYPMIEMWDGVFQRQSAEVAAALSAHAGPRAFEGMHRVLDRAWEELYRVLKPGGVACINIGDATRTIDRDFRLYTNHARILTSLLEAGFTALPDILWRKPTNAPSKFMGSGMLPAGAYVTYEHEYVLIARKGLRRDFRTPGEKSLRRQSAFFWEERNAWFSDIWFDLRGAGQDLVDETARRRSGAFPFELAYRLVCMYSVKGDTVLDPFSGTGITAAAAMASGRNAVAVELDETLLPVARGLLLSLPEFANRYLRERLTRHVTFARRRAEETGPLKHRNRHYRFPVVTTQERELLLNDLLSVAGQDGSFTAVYDERPQPEFVRAWSAKEVALSSTQQAAQIQLPLPHP